MTNWIKLLINSTSALQKPCDFSSHNHQCNELLSHLLDLRNGMKHGFEKLTRKTRQGAIDIIGSIANCLIWLGSKYAATMILLTALKQKKLISKIFCETKNHFSIQLSISWSNLNNVTNYGYQWPEIILSLSVQLLTIANNLKKCTPLWSRY